MLTQELSELLAFQAFADATNIVGIEIDPASITNERPPAPDISCLVNGRPYFFELSQIVDEDLAKDIGDSTKTKVDSDGGWYSEEEPLIGRISAKASKTYSTSGERVDLLLYYERQFPFAPAEHLKKYEAEIASALLPKGPFSRIWIFEMWKNEIVWVREA
jgi:hypothetical protein